MHAPQVILLVLWAMGLALNLNAVLDAVGDAATRTAFSRLIFFAVRIAVLTGLLIWGGYFRG